MFVTGFLAIVDTRTGRIEYVCAGHEPPICVKENGRCGKLERLSSIPFGLEPDERYDGRRHVMDPRRDGRGLHRRHPGRVQPRRGAVR